MTNTAPASVVVEEESTLTPAQKAARTRARKKAEREQSGQ